MFQLRKTSTEDRAQQMTRVYVKTFFYIWGTDNWKIRIYCCRQSSNRWHGSSIKQIQEINIQTIFWSLGVNFCISLGPHLIISDSNVHPGPLYVVLSWQWCGMGTLWLWVDHSVYSPEAPIPDDWRQLFHLTLAVMTSKPRPGLSGTVQWDALGQWWRVSV